MEKKGFQQKKTEKNQDKRDLLNVADILEFAKIVNIKEIEEVIGRQIAMIQQFPKKVCVIITEQK